MSTLPLTVRRAIEFVGLYFLATTIMMARDIITPLVMAFFLSVMLLPLQRFLKKKRIPIALSIVIPLLFVIAVLLLVVWFFSAQISELLNDVPQIKRNLQTHLQAISIWIDTKTGFSVDSQTQLINEQSDKLLNYSGNVLRSAASSFTNLLIFAGLLPIYTFLMLFYKSLLLRFVFLWFPAEAHIKVREVIVETEVIVKSYLGGLLIQITYIVVLLGGILFLFGIKHAVLIGAIFAILNLIPYVGALFGNIIGVLLTISYTQELWPIFIVLASIAFVQFLDNNILMPAIVGGKVRINALVTIVGVIIGGALAGISGMFLSLPVIAVLKIIFDHTRHLQQWGVLLGDDSPTKKVKLWGPLGRK
jgi:predicted PurR-regulated permease PerM